MANKAVRLKDENNNNIYPCPFYPVGAIYLSVNATNPSTYFGGTWVQIKDRFLLACGSYANGSSGGSKTRTLVQSNLPDRTVVRTYANSNSACTCNESVHNWSNHCLSDSGEAHNQPFDIMPPYLAIYVWKRTA